jgi:hypothetical protein
MKDTAEGARDLRAGKGYRLPLTSGVIEFLKGAIEEIETAWDAGDTAQEVYNLLPWEDTGSDQYGDRKWTSFQLREDEVRISVVLKNGRLSIDYREWYQSH